jgi:hypothetical protein
MQALGHTAISDLLQLYPEHLAVQWAGCGALLSYAKYCEPQREEMRRRVCKPSSSPPLSLSLPASLLLPWAAPSARARLEPGRRCAARSLATHVVLAARGR